MFGLDSQIAFVTESKYATLFAFYIATLSMDHAFSCSCEMYQWPAMHLLSVPTRVSQVHVCLKVCFKNKDWIIVLCNY